MRHFSFRPALTLRGRTFKGMRGWAGKPLIGGAAVSVFTALTGFWDWLESTEQGNQARRTANAHAVTMITVTLLISADVAVRIFVDWDEPSTRGLPLALTLVAAGLTIIGGTIGGSLAYDYGFNVETAGDSPVWHPSEVDLLPGQKASSPATTDVGEVAP